MGGFRWRSGNHNFWGGIALLALATFGATAGKASEGFNSSPDALSLPLQRAWQATVKVENRCKDSSSMGGIGSGVIVGTVGEKSILIATAFHVVQTANKSGSCTVPHFPIQATVMKNNKLETVSLAGVLVAKNSNEDLAILRADLSSGVSVTAAPLPETNFAISNLKGKTLYGMGFPSLSRRPKKLWKGPLPNNTTDNIQRYSQGDHFIVTEYEMESPESKTKVKRMALLSEVDFLPGNSGGPIFSPEGLLVGIATSIVNYGTEKGCNLMEYCSVAQNRFYAGTYVSSVRALLSQVK